MSKIDELITSLNKEYGGNIKIGDIEEKSVPASSIHYVESILEAVEPLYIDIPIVVAKERYFSRSYKIIDGYHRFKAKMNQGNIDAIVISDYYISRYKGDIVELLEKSVGKSMIFLSDDAMQVGQDVYEIKTNEGCGGCSSGWSGIDVDSDFVGKTIKIKTVEEQDTDNKYDDEKKLIVNGKHIATLDYGWGNGYYGGGFELYNRATMAPTEQDKEK